jgi:hypothetical protein
MHVFVVGGAIVGLSVLASLGVLWIVRRIVPHQTLVPHNDVAGYVYATIAVAYAVLLGLVLVALWDQFEETEANADREASAAEDLFRLAGGLPAPMRDAVQAAVLDYAILAVQEEWPAMRRGSARSAEAAARLEDLWRVYHDARPETDAQLALFEGSLDELDELGDLRRERLLTSDEGLFGLIWVVLIGGAIVTVVYPCIFGVESGGVHGVVIACLAATLGLLLFLAFELDHPFRGDVHVSPHGFERFLELHGVSSNESAG